jgi:hypothetical protein
MWKLGLWPCSSFSGNICFKFSALVHCSAVLPGAEAAAEEEACAGCEGAGAESALPPRGGCGRAAAGSPLLPAGRSAAVGRPRWAAGRAADRAGAHHRVAGPAADPEYPSDLQE